MHGGDIDVDDDHDLMYILVLVRAYKLLMVAYTNHSCDGELAPDGNRMTPIFEVVLG
jgi:hypothetical protein